MIRPLYGDLQERIFLFIYYRRTCIIFKISILIFFILNAMCMLDDMFLLFLEMQHGDERVVRIRVFEKISRPNKYLVRRNMCYSFFVLVNLYSGCTPSI